MQIAACILAGGMGTRIRHLLPDVPKPMAPIHGRPFVEWIVLYLARQGIDRVVISSGYLAEQVADHFGRRRLPAGRQIVCVAEREAFGTAGGFLNACEKSGMTADAWLVLNGDSLVFASVAELAAVVEDPAVDGALVCVAADDTSNSGRIVIDSAARITQFQEKQPGQGLISAGMYLFKNSLVRRFSSERPLSFERDVFPKLIREQAFLKACQTSAPFLDIGTESTFNKAAAFVAEHEREFEQDDHLESASAR